MEYLKVNVYLHYLRLKSKKWAKPTPFIKANLYSFNQLFATKFNRSPYLKTQFVTIKEKDLYPNLKEPLPVTDFIQKIL